MTRFLLFVAISAQLLIGQIKVVATTPDLAYIARVIGGKSIKVTSLMKGHEDLHMVRVRPSLLIGMRRADALIVMGLGAEHSWIPALLRGARNSKIRPGAPGFCNASRGIKALQVPTVINRGQGTDVHPLGNPHYNLDPRRMRLAARNIRDTLKRLNPGKAAVYDKRLRDWETMLSAREVTWKHKLAKFKGAPFIQGHNAWIYFANYFHLSIVGTLEPRPGLAPTPSHIKKTIRIAREKHVHFIVARPKNADVARRVAREVGADFGNILVCSSTKDKKLGWIGYMDRIVDRFARSLQG